MSNVMTVTKFVSNSLLLATGKTTALSPGDTKYDKILALGNYFQAAWADEPDVQWSSLRENFNIGTVSATNTYDLDADAGNYSDQEGDYVRITKGTSESRYTIVPIGKLYDAPKVNHYDNGKCAIVGKTLVFAHTFATTDPQFGGTITIPGFLIPVQLVNPTDELQVDQPKWLVEMVAAEYCRTDITRQGQYPNLIGMANETMKSMKAQNDSQLEEVYRPWTPGVPTDSWA